MKKLLACLAVSSALLSPCHADVLYTNTGTFSQHIGSGFTNTFTGQPATPAASYSSGGYSYTLSAAGGLYSNGDFIGTNNANQALTINFTGAAVTAIGGNFYATNINDVFQSVAMTIMLSDGTSTTFTPNNPNTFRGVTTNVAITSLVLSAAGANTFAGLDNFFVGASATAAAVPEPTTLAMLALGLGGIFAARRRTV
jgi:hypothetical protein